MSNTPTTFTQRAARRISQVVRDAERGDRNMQGIRLRTAHDGEGSPIRLGKTVALWTKGTAQSIDLYENGEPLLEQTSDATLLSYNKMADVPADRWVIVAENAKGEYYLISAECG